MNILITGGLGYIGGRVANYLKEKDPSSNIFLTTRDIHRKLPLWTDKFIPVQMDVLDESSIANCMKNKDIDIIIHLAALNEIDSMKNPDLALEVNTKGTYRLLYLANINNINKFIYLSTFHVYGETSAGVITEETPTRPFHPYAISHRAAEDFVAFFNHYHKMDTLILRLSNGYGYPMHKEINRWTLAFNDFCKQAVTTSRIVLKSSGKQFRDFISLHDVARAIYHFLFAIPDKWGDGLYNLGGDRSLSILKVVQIISDTYQEKYRKKIKEIKIESNSHNLACPKPFKYSIEKIKKTDFRLKNNITKEIKKTMSLCEKFLK